MRSQTHTPATTSALRTSVIAMRASPWQKTRFAALASNHGLSESALLGRLVDKVLESNSIAVKEMRAPRVSAAKRLRLRLRARDHALLQERARERHMKLASYLQALIQAHLRGSAVLPAGDLNLLKLAVARLALVSRQLDRVGLTAGSFELQHCLQTTRSSVEDLRQVVADTVRTQLIHGEADV